MKTTWELEMAVVQAGLPLNCIHYDVESSHSPYYQMSLENFHQEGMTETLLRKPVSVNPYYNYEKIFEQLLSADGNGYGELTKQLADVIVHYLTSIDKYEGMTKQAYYVRFLKEDMENGVYGKKEYVNLLTSKERYAVAADLLNLYKTGENMHWFCHIMAQIFPNAAICMRDNGELFMLMHCQKAENLEHKLSYLMDLFLELKTVTSLFWGDTPGVIGVDHTMVLGSFAAC